MLLDFKKLSARSTTDPEKQIDAIIGFANRYQGRFNFSLENLLKENSLEDLWEKNKHRLKYKCKCRCLCGQNLKFDSNDDYIYYMWISAYLFSIPICRSLGR